MGKLLQRLEKAGAVNLDDLSKDEKDRLEQLLTDEDVDKLTDLNKRLKADETLGPLGAACVRSG
jgi:hypothetical protein